MEKTHLKRYVICLLTASFLWGTTYPVTKWIEDVPTLFLLPIRFFIASVFLGVVFRKELLSANRYSILSGLGLGINLSILFFFATTGIKYTTSVNASFFSTLTFLIVPVLNLIMYRVKLQRSIIIGAIICLAGMFLLTHNGDLYGYDFGEGFITGLNKGDILCLLSAFHGSLEIVLLEKISADKRYESKAFTISLMTGVFLFTFVAGLATKSFTFASSVVPRHIIAILYLGLFCSAGSFLLQSIGQEYVPANRVGLIFALEPAAGCILSVFLLGEYMAGVAWLGAALIMASIIYTELEAAKKPNPITN